jgi:hypothetical protein
MNETPNDFSHPLPTREQIAARAHRIYLERGRQPGHDVDDWLQAEYELLQLPVRKIAELEPPKPEKGRVRRKSIIDLVRAAVLLGGPGLAQLGHLGKG